MVPMRISTRNAFPVYITLLAVVLLLSCTDREKYHRLLSEAEQQNSNYIPFTTDSAMLDVVDFYDSHGNANERMKAHYLLGCVYRDLGEAPQALQCYHDALDCADTTATDCDYNLLSRIHGQMAEIFGSQFLPHEMLQEERECERIARLRKDTLSIILSIERQAYAYELTNQLDSEIILKENVCQMYKSTGYMQDYAIACGTLLHPYLKRENYRKARYCIDTYEKYSGLFAPDGTIEKRREIYYYLKGLYYLGVDSLQLSESFFRKSLLNAQDANSKEAGYHGLYLLFKHKGQRDSIAKYAELSYQTNDERVRKSSLVELQHMQGMYNYGRNQTIAKSEQNKRFKVQQWLGGAISIIVLLCLLGYMIFKHQMRIRREEYQVYRTNLIKLEQAQKDLQQLNEQRIESLMEEKEEVIEKLSQEIQHFQQERINKDINALETRLTSSDICIRLHAIVTSISGYVTKDDWSQLSQLINEEIPHFYSIVNQRHAVLRQDEYHICMLVRLYFTPYEICRLTGLPSSNVSMIRTRLCEKIFGIKGNPKEFDARIQNIS